ncbi:hypothetical protein HZF08_31030 [Paenibacillus sp. CGMCC 1.16610]|uniref:Uncharacterized protein n=1 Tax=Paenibacillus anseongense TaxID=2682845 RepID=A0ABW9UDE7_9BACL|nr:MULTISPECIES: hypothetical protein [Paenibacillus]MBA2942706.1 hypothetical protein [Paenibacillus sp. CGMCC 1.16610]MVQ38192.1 hypothetical protein [Paenibacillus anseongense]
MFLLNVCTTLIAVGAVVSLGKMPKLFDRFEKWVYYMVILIAIEQLHSAIVDNFKLIQFAESFWAFYFYKLNQILIFPIGTLWLLVPIFQANTRFLIKILYIGIWFSALTGSYHLFQFFGILTLTGWNIGYSMVIWYTALLELTCFCLVFRKMLGKCDGHDPLPT